MPRSTHLRRTLLLLVLASCAACQLAENLAVSMFRSPERSGRLVDGKQEGRWVFRFPDGETKAEGEYLDDKQVGRWVYWYQNGNVEWEGEFDAQRLEGPSMFGYENGNRQAVGMFIDGLEEDLWTFWNEDGKLDHRGGGCTCRGPKSPPPEGEVVNRPKDLQHAGPAAAVLPSPVSVVTLLGALDGPIPARGTFALARR